MRFWETGLEGAWLLEPVRTWDERGFFSRIFCEHLFGEQGLETRFVQHSISYSRARGTSGACISSGSRMPKPSS